MRIRKFAKLLASNNQDEASSPQQKEEEAIGDENNNKKKVVNEIDAIEDNLMIAKPIGDVVKVSGEGRMKRNHFASFEYDNIHYDIEDSVMFCAEKEDQMPYVAIIKDITQTIDGSMMVKVQWFYRPEDTKKKGGGNWKSNETRELYYSFHQDETPVESLLHKCVVHFIPLNKQLPCQRQHPGFIVQKIYDPKQRRLFKFTDNVYEKSQREEIHLLIQKTMSRVSTLPDIDQNDQLKKKRISAKKRPNA